MKRKFTAIMLSFMMVVTMIPSMAFASSGSTSDETGATLSATVYEKQSAISTGTGILVAGNYALPKPSEKVKTLTGTQVYPTGSDNWIVASATEWTVTSSGSGYTLKNGDKYFVYNRTVGTDYFNTGNSQVWTLDKNTLKATHNSKTRYITLAGNTFKPADNNNGGTVLDFYTPVANTKVEIVVKNKTVEANKDNNGKVFLPEVTGDGSELNAKGFYVKYQGSDNAWYTESEAKAKASLFPAGNASEVTKDVVVGLFYGTGSSPVDSVKANVKIGDPRDAVSFTVKSPLVYYYYEGKTVTAKGVFEAIVDTGKTMKPENFSENDVTIEYNASNSNSNSNWQSLNYTPTSVSKYTNHTFGSKSSEQVRLTYNGNDSYKNFQNTYTITITDPRTATSFTEKTNPVFNYYEGKTISNKGVIEAIIDTSKTITPADLIDNITVKYKASTATWEALDYEPATSLAHKFGSQEEEKIRLTYNGNDFYYGFEKEYTLKIQDTRATVSFTEKTNPKVYYYYDGMTINNDDVIKAVVDTTQTVTPSDFIGKVTIEYLALEALGVKTWKSLNFEPANAFQGHKFGSESTEQVRLTYAGTEEYKKFQQEYTVSIVDPRKDVSYTLKDPMVYYYYDGKTIDENEVYESIVDKTKTKDPTTFSKNDVTIEFLTYSGLGVENWQSLTYVPVTELAHKFGSQDKEKVRFTYKGNSEYKNFEREYELQIKDPRTPTKIVITEGKGTEAAPFELELNGSTDSLKTDIKVYEYTNNVVGNVISDAEITFEPEKTPDISDGDSEVVKYTAKYAGKTGVYKKADDVNFYVKLTAPRTTYTLESATGIANGKVTVNDVTSLPGRRSAELGFTVVAKPDNGFFTTEIKIVDSKGAIVAQANNNDETPIMETDTVTVPAADVKVGETYTISATFEKMTATLRSNIEINYFDIKAMREGTVDEQKAAKERIENAIVKDIVLVGPKSFMDDAASEVEYLSGKVLTADVYHSIDYTPEELELLALHRFGNSTLKGSLELGNTETVRVTYTNTKEKYKDVKVEGIQTVTVKDLRTPTKMSISYTDLEQQIQKLGLTTENVIPVYHGQPLSSQLQSRIKIMTDEETPQPVTFELADITTDDMPDVALLKTQTVKVYYGGSQDYKPCEAEVTIYVIPEDASLTVKGEVVSYDGKEHYPTIIANPEDLDYFTLIAGIDGDIEGFFSFDFPKSTKEKMRIQLTHKSKDASEGRTLFEQWIGQIGSSLEDAAIDTTMEGIANSVKDKNKNIVIEKNSAAPYDWYLDIYKTLSNMSDNGELTAENLESMINAITTLSGENSLVGGSIEKSGFDISSLSTALKVLKGLNTYAPNSKIRLGKGPVNAGIYSVTAFSTDLNYKISYSTNILTILPQTDGVSIKWNQELPTNRTLTYEAAQNFDFGVTATGVADKNVKVFFSDATFSLSNIDLYSQEPDLTPGIHIETVYVFGGNTWTTPMSRLYIIERMGTDINAEDKTVTYNGQPQDIVEKTASAGDLTNKLTYSYTGDALLNTNYHSSKAPTNVGFYYATIKYAGDDIHAAASKTVKLTIEPADAEMSDLNIEGWTYGQSGNNPSVTVASIEAPSASDCPDADDVVYTYYKAKLVSDNWQIDGNALSAKPVNAGEYIVKASLNVTKNYNKPVDLEKHFTIAQKAINYKAGSIRITKGSIIDEKLIKDLFVLDEPINGDVVSLDYAKFNVSYYSEKFGTQDMSLAQLIQLIRNAQTGNYYITLTSGLTGKDASNYTLGENATKTATLTIYPKKKKAATYTITCDEGVTADRDVAPANTTITLTVEEGYENPAVKDEDGKEIIVSEKNDKYTFTMPASDVTVSVKSTKDDVSNCNKDATCPLSKFKDLILNEWYHDGAHYCVEKGIIKGVTEDTFVPNGTTTRGTIVTMLWRMSGEKAVNYNLSFKDVGDNEWFTEGIRWAKAEKIVDGYNADSFGPNDKITREQLATILYRYAKYCGVEGMTGMWYFQLQFNDTANISEWADEALHWCYMKGIVTGKNGNMLEPQGYATRAETATMLYRLSKLFA